MLVRATLIVCAILLFSADGLAAQRAARRTWVIPHVLERAGRVANTPNTFDTDLHVVNLDQRATLEIRAFGEDGQPMLSRSGTPVCNPCTLAFREGAKQVFSLDERITAAGGFAREMMSGYLVITSTGPASVNMQAFIVNSHASSLNLSVFGFEPQPISADAQ
jgi:hypothetical protein